MSELLEKIAFTVPRTKPHNSKRNAMHSVVLALVIADIALPLARRCSVPPQRLRVYGPRKFMQNRRALGGEIEFGQIGTKHPAAPLD